VPPEIIKVCGITNVADAVFAAQQGATAIGLIFYPGSPRAVRPEEAAVIAAVVPGGVLRVGVFVNESPAQVRAVAAAARLDVVQLHGDETPEMCRGLEGLRIWKAFRVDDRFEADELGLYACEAFFLDAASEDGSFGGSGRTFPWSRAHEAKRFGHVIIAGGLDGDNVADAIAHAAPWGVDASSRLERRPGIKDHDKVKHYLAAARGVQE
jgi:phosphoribosylanthranilate isomerase